MRSLPVRAVSLLGPAILAAALGPACGPDDVWHCCQVTAFTCVCSATGNCSGVEDVEKCSIDTLSGTDNACCAHAAGSCSCSGSDGGTPSSDLCSAEGDRLVDDCSSEPPPGPSGDCTAGEAGTDQAPCEKDSDCYSAFCDSSASPAVCAPPTREARVAGHGYDCASDAECEAVAPSLVERGATATCVNDAAVSGCDFACE